RRALAREPARLLPDPSRPAPGPGGTYTVRRAVHNAVGSRGRGACIRAAYVHRTSRWSTGPPSTFAAPVVTRTPPARRSGEWSGMPAPLRRFRAGYTRRHVRSPTTQRTPHGHWHHAPHHRHLRRDRRRLDRPR